MLQLQCDADQYSRINTSYTKHICFWIDAHNKVLIITVDTYLAICGLKGLHLLPGLRLRKSLCHFHTQTWLRAGGLKFGYCYLKKCF